MRATQLARATTHPTHLPTYLSCDVPVHPFTHHRCHPPPSNPRYPHASSQIPLSPRFQLLGTQAQGGSAETKKTGWTKKMRASWSCAGSHSFRLRVTRKHAWNGNLAFHLPSLCHIVGGYIQRLKTCTYFLRRNRAECITEDDGR